MVEPLSSFVGIIPAILPSEGVAAQTAINGAVLDLSAYNADAFAVMITFGVITTGAVTSFKVQTDTAAAFSSAQDIAGSNQTVADTKDDKTFVSDIINPPEPYCRVAVSRGTQNAVVASAHYLVYRLRAKPFTQTGTETVEVHRDKAVGTA